MATVPSNRSPNQSIPLKNRKWILLLPILVLLVLSLTLCPVYLFYRLNVLETRLYRFKTQVVSCKQPIEGLLQEDIDMRPSRDMPSQHQSELLALKASVENSKMQIRQLTEVVEQYNRVYFQNVADQRIYIDRTISQLIADIEAERNDLLNVGGTVQEDSANIDTLQLDAQDSSEEVSTKQEQVTDLDPQSNNDDDGIIEPTLHWIPEEAPESLVGQELESPKRSSVSEERSEFSKEEKTQPKPMNPFDSSDEDETLEFRKKDEEAIVKLLKKASEKMQDGLKKGKKQMEKAMDKVKTATKKMREKAGGVGDKIGEKISGQVQKLMENGRKVNEYIKSIIGATGRSGSDFDSDLEL